MIAFYGGPADGETLMLRRSPQLLRVVINAAGKLDALDQLEDVAEAGETIHVYKRKSVATPYHLYFGGGKNSKRNGWYARAEYEYLETPADEAVRAPAAWQAWARIAAAIHFPKGPENVG